MNLGVKGGGRGGEEALLMTASSVSNKRSRDLERGGEQLAILFRKKKREKGRVRCEFGLTSGRGGEKKVHLQRKNLPDVQGGEKRKKGTTLRSKKNCSILLMMP